jgi:lipopolysaccharide/colanic/teichoic acid biosynthesis glycosyltransferase
MMNATWTQSAFEAATLDMPWRRATRSFFYPSAKRALDILGAGLGLVLLLPRCSRCCQ